MGWNAQEQLPTTVEGYKKTLAKIDKLTAKLRDAREAMVTAYTVLSSPMMDGSHVPRTIEILRKAKKAALDKGK